MSRITVSYTHLDVYKRQAVYRWPDGVGHAGGKLPDFLCGGGLCADGIRMGQEQPDVYKRQLPDSVPAQPRLEDLYLWLFPEEMEEAK